MPDTVSVKQIGVPAEYVKDVVEAVQDKKVIDEIKQLNKKTEQLMNWIVSDSKNSSMMKFESGKVVYSYSIEAFLPRAEQFTPGHMNGAYEFKKETFKNEFNGLEGVLCTLTEMRKLAKDEYLIPYIKKGYKYFTVTNQNLDVYAIIKDNGVVDGIGRFNEYSYPQREVYHIPCYHQRMSEGFLYSLIWRKLLISGLPDDLHQHFIELCSLYEFDNDFLNKRDCQISASNSSRYLVYCMHKKKGYSPEEIAQELIKAKTPIKATAELSELMQEVLLRTDKARADIDEYDNHLLTDPQRGHWDLWNGNESGALKVDLPQGLMARDPASSINRDGIIGIDFGTKSTVVVYQKNSNKTNLMIVGKGSLKKEITEEYYENPTVMEFISLEKFLKAYNEKPGRPETLWSQVTTSHTAAESLLNSNSEMYYSHLNELKQWAGDSRRQLRLRDQDGKEYLLPPFLELKDGDFNPIELYAYYIGLYINNMRNGIYKNYLLSYPITYDKEVRDKLIQSFERGIKKSLPNSVLQSEEMKDFVVREGVSEPVAYASCALAEYGFEPEEDEKIFYGVFDFGGGTTDFDFGLYYESETRRYDYVLECLGSGGDKYLGGENLLELMAYEVFLDNLDMMRSGGYSFIKPHGCDDFSGSAELTMESQESKLNTKLMMRELRDYWEGKQTERYEAAAVKGQIKLNLYSKNTSQSKAEDLKVNIKKLDQVLEKRIEQGVVNFFERLKTAFDIPKTSHIEQIHIFLAGNSSKSAVVQKIFKSYIEKETEQILGKPCKAKLAGSGEPFICRTDKFILYPPLGSGSSLNANQLENVRSQGVNPAENLNKAQKTTQGSQSIDRQKSDGTQDSDAALSKYLAPKSNHMANIQQETSHTFAPLTYRKNQEEALDIIRKVTGKTGVAFGLLKCRPGGKIQIIQNMKENGQIPFKYYIGYEKKARFRMITDTTLNYNEWIKFDEAYNGYAEDQMADIEIYYSSSPEVTTNKVDIGRTQVARRRVPNKEGAMIYYRAVKPSVMEYTVAYEDKLNAGEFLMKPEQIVLEE